jgi:probable F420-dependent oxidoreductase
MTEAAGEVADGLLCHGFSTERYVREVTLPALERGRAKAGKTIEGFEISAPAFVVARDSEEEIAAGIQFVRNQIGFYGSTPAYRPVLAAHGWQDLQPELNALSKQGRWEEMGGLIDDEVLHTIAACGRPADVARHIRERVDGVGDTICLYQAAPIGLQTLAAIIDELR